MKKITKDEIEKDFEKINIHDCLPIYAILTKSFTKGNYNGDVWLTHGPKYKINAIDCAAKCVSGSKYGSSVDYHVAKVVNTVTGQVIDTFYSDDVDQTSDHYWVGIIGGLSLQVWQREWVTEFLNRVIRCSNYYVIKVPALHPVLTLENLGNLWHFWDELDNAQTNFDEWKSQDSDFQHLLLIDKVNKKVVNHYERKESREKSDDDWDKIIHKFHGYDLSIHYGVYFANPFYGWTNLLLTHDKEHAIERACEYLKRSYMDHVRVYDRTTRKIIFESRAGDC